MASRTQFHFGDFVLDEAAVELRRGGGVLPIQPKAFRLLAHLIAHRDRVLSKNELLDALWPGEFVSESSLTFCIATIRRALGENTATGSCIRALRGTGYRFVADVRSEPGPGGDAPASRVADAPRPDPARRSLFVGREAETNVFRLALAELLRGCGSIVFLSGEAGIGKSRAMQEFALLAEQQGAAALFGRTFDSEVGLPFWIWIEVVRDYVRTHDADVIREVMGAGVADIAHIVPTLRQKLGEIPQPPPLDPDQARLRMFDSLAAFLWNAAKRRPLVLCLDDLQWADTSSLLLLQYLAQDIAAGAVLVIGTCRDTELDDAHPLRRTRQVLSRAGWDKDLKLGGLCREDVGILLGSIADTTKLSDESLTAVTSRTGGNPLFLEQLYAPDGDRKAALTMEPGGPTLGEAAVPDSIRAVVQQRLRSLSEPARRVLSVASVFGQAFSYADLARLTEAELPEGIVLDALDEAHAARWLEEAAGALGTYRFAHELIREAAHLDLGSLRRARLHGLVAATLEQSSTASAADLAYHFLRCAGDAALAKALDYSMLAAEEATRQYAYEESARHYEAALALLDRVAPADDGKRCRMSLALGEAYYLGGHVAQSRTCFAAAAALARRLGSPTLFADAAMGMFGPRPIVEEMPVDLLQEALESLDADERELRAQLMARLAMQLANIPDSFVQRQPLARDAIALARQLGNPRVMAVVLHDVLTAVWNPDAVEERAALIEELEQNARAAGMQGWEMGARVFRIVHTMELGDLHAVRTQLSDFCRLAEALRQPGHRWNAMALSATEALSAGRLPAAEALMRRAHEAGMRMGEGVNATIVFIVQLHLLGRFTGRADLVQAEAFRYPEAQHPALRMQWALPFLLVVTGQAELARQVFDGLKPTISELPTRDTLRGRFTSSTLAAAACFYLDDREAAAVLYEQLLPYAKRWVVASLGIGLCGCIAASLGGLAATLGDWRAAVEHFEYALTVHREQDAVGELAVTQIDYALALCRRGGSDDLVRAGRLLEDAAALAAGHGFGMVQNRVESIRSEMSARR